MKTSPTQRSLAMLRKEGFVVAIVERWNPHARIRQDLFGGIDLLALGAGSIIGIQTTSASNVSARLAKIKDEPRLKKWIENGGRLFVHGWAKRGARGKRKLWSCDSREVFVGEFAS